MLANSYFLSIIVNMAEPNIQPGEKVIRIDNQKFDEARKNLELEFIKNDMFSVKEHNTVFRQMASQLILIAGIFLALSSQFGALLSSSSDTVKGLSIFIITLLNFSIAFGVLQHLMEANFFKKLALGRRDIFYGNERSDPLDLQKYIGAQNEFTKIMNPGTKRWPSYVQMSLLAVAMILISVVATLKLYGS